MPDELVRLMQRYNQLGRLLPTDEFVNDTLPDVAKLAECRIILAEMAKTKIEIDAFLAGSRH